MAIMLSRQAWILAIASGLGLSLSVLATASVRHWEVEQQQSRFQRQIEGLTIAQQRSLNRYTTVLNFLSDLYRVQPAPVPQRMFEGFVARSLAVYPGIQALEWAPLVLHDDRDAYEQAIRAEGYPDFALVELDADGRLIPAGDRPYYLPVTYIAPLASNEAALGFDLNSSPVRAAALEPARDSGMIQATSRVRLVQEPSDQYGFLVVSPLYQTDVIPDQLIARRTAFRGVLLGVFRVADVIEEALQGLSYPIDFVLRDRSAPADEQFLGYYAAAEQTVLAAEPTPSAQAARRRAILCPQPTSCTRTLALGQRQWSLAFSPAADYPLAINYNTWIALLAGLLLTGSLLLFLRNLQQELARAKTLSDLKQQFFATLSHELYTPLSTILVSTESLQVNYYNLSDRQKQAGLQRIETTARVLGQQIADLLTLTRAEAGKLEFNPELIEIVAVVQQAIADLQPSLPQTITLRHNCQSARAFWDQKLLRSLLSNLLTNAAKYSPESSAIQVSVTSDHRAATLQVSDRGIGIPAAEQAQIREAFQRGSNVGAIAGTGLGLAMVEISVEQHHGQWHIDSREGQGTTVTVTLPLE